MNFIKQIASILKISTIMRSLSILFLPTFFLHANDLIIHDFSVVTKLDGVEVTSSEFGCLIKDSQSVSFDVELWTTWDCGTWGKSCSEEKEPFYAEFYIFAVVRAIGSVQGFP